MTLDEIKVLASAGESAAVEFKSSTANLSRAAESLCGMLNGAGGVVLIGVTDRGEVVGQQVADATLRDVAGVLREFDPSAPVEVERVAVREGREVLVLRARSSIDEGPWLWKGRAWQRLGPTTSAMNQTDYFRLLLSRGRGVTLWETLPAHDYDIGDLDEREVLRTLRLGIECGRIPDDAGNSVEDVLDRFGLRRDGRLLTAAVVLFAKKVTPDYPQCGIRLARCVGTTKDEFLDNRQEYGHAFALLEEAMAFFRRNLSIASRFQADSIVRQDLPEYPILALREAVVNALIHRSYVEVGGAVSVAIYSDRLEVWNDGVLPFGQLPEELKRSHPSRPRNPLIANAFFRRGLIEAWGRGTQKIVELCVAAGHPEPEFWMQGGSWMVVTFRPRVASTAASLPGQVDDRERGILEVLAGGSLPLRDIHAALTGASLRVIREDLQRLQREGLVAREGRGRGARWALVKRP